MKLISGGQSGVDRAVLDAAIARGIEYGGYCPAGGWAEDFQKPPGVLAKYPKLQATPSADPAERTAWNVRDADACLILVDDAGVDVSNGTAQARALAHAARKPVLAVNLRGPDALKHAALWLRVQRGKFGETFALAVGGPRESEAPGIYAAASAFIAALLDESGG